MLHYSDYYHSTSVTRLLVYLEKNYEINFPQSLNNVKAGERYIGFDGSSMFILKFQLGARELDHFLEQFGNGSWNFQPFRPEADKRIGSAYPDWFKSPIEEGQVGKLDIRGFKVDHHTDIYIDRSNENDCTVYMEGFYRI